ncbi:uncharacterized protein LOC112088936 [Eutrema salsugineum]|uniref:uncharacterized protein LOC112088936 n=1 Tax=Eutrema salsugineum TaxID=72664 RepID=UPI000CECEA63|nr:uncharacterized protein LOC112088936 [Eutrema salsugineum]
MTVSSGKIPDSYGLNECMHQEALKEVEDYVKKIKGSWAVTGSSILLDAWVDKKGRDLVTFVADSPAGPVYLKSFDVSDIKTNVSALTSLVNGLVDEVGVHNVIQIVACSTSGWVGELGKSFEGNNKEVFWSVSVSHCFELILRKLARKDSLKDIVDDVNKITGFINNNPLILDLVKKHSSGKDVIVPSELEFVIPYLSLERIFEAKKAGMFASSDWKKYEDITISKLQVGTIYDTMDCIKESIAKEFNDKKRCYMPVWDVIDDVWNRHLHSPLHAAGYFLNPTTFYATDFSLDSEVATGLISSLVHVVKERQVQAKVATQLDMYKLNEDCFKETSQADQSPGISPAEWWAQKASKHRELQGFAIKILSQTCEGASRYKLERSFAEKMLLTEGMSHSELKHREELVFVHYNLHLQSCKAKTK